MRAGGVPRGESVTKRWDNLWTGVEKRINRLLWTAMDIIEVDEDTRYLVDRVTDYCPLCRAGDGHAEAVFNARENFRRPL